VEAHGASVAALRDPQLRASCEIAVRAGSSQPDLKLCRFREGMASAQRIRDEARIRRTTRALVFGSLAATAAFGGLAAAATHHDSAAVQTQQRQQRQDQTFGAPEQSYSPPVAQSNGS
jgi:hypothetical protein